MHLENISLSNFKNYQRCDLEFSPHINCIVGPNGSGKTNLLDAIHYLSLTKSAFSNIDQQAIRHLEDFFAIRGTFSKNGKEVQLQCSLKSGGKKAFLKDKKPYIKLSEHVGNFPSVLITPYDTDLIREGSEVRRKFLNNILAQIDGEYLDDLMNYQHLLRQRNQLLKDMAGGKPFDALLINSYDEPMIGLCQKIHKRRNSFMVDFLEIFKKHYALLSDHKEQVEISYRSHLQSQNFAVEFMEALQKDMALQRSTKGVHRDDLVFTIENHSLKKFGSQGQQKCFVIALKLAQFETITNSKGFKPLLLLDDIFDKLDDRRIEKLMTMVAGQVFGQLFMTDARPERTSRILEKIDAEQQTFLVESGEVKPHGLLPK